MFLESPRSLSEVHRPIAVGIGPKIDQSFGRSYEYLFTNQLIATKIKPSQIGT
jgi:hypothetical protein